MRLPSGTPAIKREGCSLARPCLRQPQVTRRFRFFDATLLLVVSGALTLYGGTQQLTADAPTFPDLGRFACLHGSTEDAGRG